MHYNGGTQERTTFPVGQTVRFDDEDWRKGEIAKVHRIFASKMEQYVAVHHNTSVSHRNRQSSIVPKSWMHLQLCRLHNRVCTNHVNSSRSRDSANQWTAGWSAAQTPIKQTVARSGRVVKPPAR